MCELSIINQDPDKTNNEFHQTILDRDDQRCLALLKQNDVSEEELNKQSLGNTPLMLALKTGLINVAEAFVLDDRVLVNMPDARKLSPLHYACFLREDRLINSLLDREADYYHLGSVSSWPFQSGLFQIHPARRFFLEQTDPIELYQTDEFKYSSRSIPAMIQDSDEFFFQPLILTDILFHIDKVCLNYKLKQKDDFKEADKNPCSAAKFSRYAFIGLDDILLARRNRPVNEEVLERLSLARKSTGMVDKPERQATFSI